MFPCSHYMTMSLPLATLEASISVTDFVPLATRGVNSPGPQPTSKTFFLRRLSIFWSNSGSPSLLSRRTLSRRGRSLSFHFRMCTSVNQHTGKPETNPLTVENKCQLNILSRTKNRKQTHASIVKCFYPFSGDETWRACGVLPRALDIFLRTSTASRTSL